MSSFWNEKKVLITGGNGFIGSWLTERIIDEGADVTLLIKKEDPVGLKSLPNLSKKTKIIYSDLREEDKVKAAIKDQEYIFHLAAITQVIYGIHNPREVVDVDINGTLNIIEAMRNGNSDAHLVFTSTDKVYGEPEYVPIDEKHPLSAKSPYDASKLGADRLVYSYHVTYGMKTAISRCSNVIGGRDFNILRAIPSFVYFLMNNRQPIIRTNGKYVRDYMYVDDAVNGILLLGEKQEKSNGKAFNFGTGKSTDVIEIAREVIHNFENTTVKEPHILGKDMVGEIERQYLSFKRANELLGWSPKISFKEGVRRSVAWYKQNPWWVQLAKETAKYYELNMEALFS